MSKQQSNRSRSKIGRVSVWRNLLSIATKNQREAAPVGSSNRTDAVADFGRSSLPRRNFQIAVRRTKVGPACRAGFFVTAARRSVCGLQHRASKNHHRYLRPPDCEMAPCKVAGRGEAAKSFPAERTYDYFRRRRTKVGSAWRAGFFVTAARRSVCGLQHRAAKTRHRYLRLPDFDMTPCKVASRGEPRSPFRQKGPTTTFAAGEPK